MRKKNRKLLFSIGKNDFTIQTFKSGGKGGQHQNTTDSGVRIIHKESGAVGLSRDGRSQYQNKKMAFQRLTSSGKFKIWLNRKVNEIDIGKTIEQLVEEDMKPHNLKVEVKDDNGKWSIE